MALDVGFDEWKQLRRSQAMGTLRAIQAVGRIYANPSRRITSSVRSDLIYDRDRDFLLGLTRFGARIAGIGHETYPERLF